MKLEVEKGLEGGAITLLIINSNATKNQREVCYLHGN